MHQLKTTTLTTIFSEILADLAFMFTEDGRVDRSLEAPWLETTISYDGPVAGTLRLRCTMQFSTKLFANLLGEPQDELNVEQNAHDAVKEFMNIVCGRFITSAYGTEDVFDLTIPEIAVVTEAADLPIGGDVEVLNLSVDGEPIQLLHAPRVEPHTE